VASVKIKPDPWKDLGTKAIAEVLARRGWPVRETPRGLDVDLGAPGGGGVVAVVIAGKAGEDNLAKLTGLHGELPPAPRWASGAGARVALYRAPASGLPVPSAENLHGAVAGVSILARGAVAIPPSVEASHALRWRPGAHAAEVELTELPAWLADLARDPVAAKRAWSTARPTPEEKRELSAWEAGLVRSRGRVVNTFANLCTILRHAPRFAGKITWNEMAFSVCFEGRPVADGDIGRWRELLEREHGISPGADSIRLASQTVAEEHRVHPVKEYLLRQEWDGAERLNSVAQVILGAEGELPALMVRKWFLSAVARALRPGCKVDTALVLVGPQGAKKSTFFSVLAGEWFTDTHVDLSSKDAFLQLAGAWVVEWGEIERVTGRRGADEIKSFMSSRADRFRPPYGRALVEVPRTCVVVGSTNQSTFLDDETGSRRFWCVRVPGGVAIDQLRAWRDQLWAEARAAFDAGEVWWLDADEEKAREEDAETHTVDDSWEAKLARWASSQTAQNFTADEVLRGAFSLEPKDQTKGAAMRMGRALVKLGWERRKGRPVRVVDGGTKTLPPAWLWIPPADQAQPSLPTDEGASYDEPPPF
jgi:putative DNA primase/helicase